MTVNQAINALNGMPADAELKAQFNCPNGYTFATGRVESIFANPVDMIVDVYAEDADAGFENCLDDTDFDEGDEEIYIAKAEGKL
jgi:hypothetical protein